MNSRRTQFHITYTDRFTGATETGRVFITDQRGCHWDAARRRAVAIREAGWKYPNARRASISAVAVAIHD